MFHISSSLPSSLLLGAEPRPAPASSSSCAGLSGASPSAAPAGSAPAIEASFCSTAISSVAWRMKALCSFRSMAGNVSRRCFFTMARFVFSRSRPW